VRAIGFKKFRESLKVRNGYTDQLYAYQKPTKGRSQNYNLNKNDTFIYLRSSDRLLNPEAIRRQVGQSID
jgi:hypothetical protein